jgi:Spy/CpxP family protein refolding chaperone
MKKNGFPIRVAIAAAFLILSAAPGRIFAQSAPPPPVGPPPTIAAPPAPAQPSAARHQFEDDFAGLSYTDEQKAKIDEIRKNTHERMNAVIKDDKLAPGQKEAFLTGLQRIEAGQMFEVLTPEQKKEVRKKMDARRAAAGQKPQYPTAPAPH